MSEDGSGKSEPTGRARIFKAGKRKDKAGKGKGKENLA